MHLHLVRFQILDRRVFDTFAYIMHKATQVRLTAAEQPAANELRLEGCGSVSTRHDHPYHREASRDTRADYLYHCHILEHEANDMMRPFQVIA